jgi:hypothetical protein
MKIYKLIYDGEIIYVGLTTLSLSRRKGSANYSVPKEIYKKSKIELIEETDNSGRERYWINYYLSIGCNLYNKRGGDYDKETSQKENSKRYYQENKEIILNKMKIYYQENKDVIIKRQIEYNREYRKNNR